MGLYRERHEVAVSRRDFVIALVALLAAVREPINSSAQTTETPRVQDSEEYFVYSAILTSQFAHTNVQQFVIRAETSVIEKPEYFDRLAPDVESDTMSDFKAKNEKSELLERRLDLKTPYVLVSKDELDAMLYQKVGDPKVGVLVFMGGWARFYERYPGAHGLINFSRVGFDSKKQQALVYVAVQHDYLGGSSRLLVLSKGDKSWEVQKQILISLN
jgi:hypothetical protein